MNKAIKSIVLLIALLVARTASADVTTWANDPEIYDWSGAANLVLDGYTDYIIRIYKSVDNTINFGVNGGIAMPGSDDTYSGIQFNWNSAGLDGFCYQEVQNSDTTWGLTTGTKIYSVIFSQSPSSGYFAVVDGSLKTVSYTAGNMDYNAGGVNGGLVGSGGDWQAVPEPATIGLMAIGGGLAWLVRLKQRIG